MKRNFILTGLALMIAGFFTCGTVAEAASWTYPDDMADLPYYEGLGTEESPYLINSAQQLADLAWHVNNGSSYEGVYFALTADIDLNPGFTFGTDGTVEGDGEPQAWVPIGHDWRYNMWFQGNFDGNGHTISGLYLDMTYLNNGLFGAVRNGVISNLNVKNSLAKGDVRTEDCNSVGFVVGWMETGEIDNCHNYGCSIYRDALSFTPDPFAFETFAGGIAGQLSYSSVNGCSNTGNIKCESVETGYIISTTSTGGIVGYIEGYEGCSVSDCKNSGDVYCSGMAGGIAGYMSIGGCSAARLSNEGEINGVFQSGGIIGYGEVAMLSECSNSGLVTSHDGSVIGGIAGRLSVYDSMSQCENTGRIIYDGKSTSGNKAAGLVADFMAGNATISECRNEAPVYGCGTLGGLFAYCDNGILKIETCYNAGEISLASCDEVLSQENLGGLIGNGIGCNEIKISDSYNVGNVTGGRDCTACGFGNIDVRQMDNCYNKGNITGSYAYGLIAGTADTLTYCYNEGDVYGLEEEYYSSEANAAGLVNVMAGKMLNCHNSGNVSTEKSYIYSPDFCNTAGLCLSLYNSDVEQCYNIGDVAGHFNSGGLFGVMATSSVSNCYNAGKVTGDKVTGGIAAIYDCNGNEADVIANTFSYGDVALASQESPDAKTGMFIGQIKTSSFTGENASLAVTNCYYKDTTGGLIPGVYQNDCADLSGLSACTEDDFASGRICVLLNGTQDPTPWGQDVGTDAYPLLNGKGNPDDVGIRLPESFNPESLEGQPVYDLQGCRVNAPLTSLHGIYIVGGRKVLLP